MRHHRHDAEGPVGWRHPHPGHRPPADFEGPGHWQHHPGRGRGRGRVPRGDVRAAVLLLLAEEPMHGYQLMQAIAERTGGRWSPSPGAIYPTINQLEDEGLVSVTAEGGRKLATLTEAGREHVATNRDGWPDPFGGLDAADSPANLRPLVGQLLDAVRQVARSGTEAQLEAAGRILTEARRSLYLVLADGPEHDTC